jgi:hypothetical protein
MEAQFRRLPIQLTQTDIVFFLPWFHEESACPDPIAEDSWNRLYIIFTGQLK